MIPLGASHSPNQEIHQAARSKVLFASRCRGAPKMAVEVAGVGGSGVEVLERAQKLMKTRTWLCLWNPLVMIVTVCELEAMAQSKVR